MDNLSNYDISFFGEFVDKGLEAEFFNYDMRRYAKVIGPVTFIFGVIYLLFLISDYFAIQYPFPFMYILITRVSFLVISIVVYFVIKKIKNHSNLSYLVSIYEILAIIGFLVIVYFYKSLSLLSFYSILTMTLAIYIIPNKLIYTQLISIFLSLAFFIFHVKHIEGMESPLLFKMIIYNILIVINCNIGAYLTNYYKRKQFIDSRELLRVSTTDSLTGICNRAKFNEELIQWIDYCSIYYCPLSLVILDIDDFKKVNDVFGHLTGDSVIKNIASTIKKIIRQSDIFARWGGEEFVILLPYTDIPEAMKIMEQMRANIQKNKFGKVENITCSFGLVSLRKNENAESLLHRADKLLYNAKEFGKNAVFCETVDHEKTGVFL